MSRNFIDLNCVCIFRIGNMHRLKLTIDYTLFLSRSVINQGFLTMVIIMVQCLYTPKQLKACYGLTANLSKIRCIGQRLS